MIDLTVPYEGSRNIEAAYHRKVTKYQSFGMIEPLIIGSIGFWHPKNDDIRALAIINPKIWADYRRKIRTIAIEQSLNIFRSYINPSTAPSHPSVIASLQKFP